MRIKTAILITLTVLMSACGTFKKATSQPDDQTTAPTTAVTTDPYNAIITNLGDWQTMQTGGNIKLNAGSSFSSSIQVRMVRDQAIYISIRPMLGIEVGKILITADSLFAVDKVHKRFIANKLTILTAGVPVTVSDMQDIFLGRPFTIGHGTLGLNDKGGMTVFRDGNITKLTPAEQYKGYGYTFTFDKNYRITSLDIMPAGSTTPVYQVKYNDVNKTTAGNIAHGINVDATIEQKKVSFSLSYKDIDWNKEVKIDRSIPGGYKRMDAGSLFNLFSN